MDFKSAALELDAEEAAIKAVAAVESSGNGFTVDAGMKVPKVLFERHVMFRQLSNKFGSAKAEALASQYPDLVNPTPGGYTRDEHGRLARATAIDRECALSAASWGAFQIMGYHWKNLGYESLQEFINEMYTDQGQLNAFVKFIKADSRLLRALRNKEWSTFARIYNGPNYSKFNYDKKMALEYAKALA